MHKRSTSYECYNVQHRNTIWKLCQKKNCAQVDCQKPFARNQRSASQQFQPKFNMTARKMKRKITLFTNRHLQYSKKKHCFDLKLQSENRVRCLIQYRCVRCITQAGDADIKYMAFTFLLHGRRSCTYGIYGHFFFCYHVLL